MKGKKGLHEGSEDAEEEERETREERDADSKDAPRLLRLRKLLVKSVRRFSTDLAKMHVVLDEDIGDDSWERQRENRVNKINASRQARKTEEERGLRRRMRDKMFMIPEVMEVERVRVRSSIAWEEVGRGEESALALRPRPKT
jgi:hypothetical protein